jgi:hypothetical protein
MSQKERVLEYMKEHGSISSMEAFRDLGVTRLSAVVFNLRADGYKVKAVNEKSVNRFGEKTNFARYSIAE